MYSLKTLVLPIFAASVIHSSCSSTNASTQPQTVAAQGNAPQRTTVQVQTTPELFTARITRRTPHDARAFTQGLEFFEGQLLESTGLNGRSSLRVVDPQTGRVLRGWRIPEEFFAEGLTVFQSKIYLLTYQSQRCIVFDAHTLQPLRDFRYEGEGWGLTHNEQFLLMSDGTSTIRFIRPDTFEVDHTITVREGNRPVTELNELEMVDGELWANVWHQDRIARINPSTGAITGWISLTDIVSASQPSDPEGVLNGIAYDPSTRRLVITGKLWSLMYDIEIHPLQRRTEG